MTAKEMAIRADARALLKEVGLVAAPVDPERVAIEKGLRVETKRGFPADIYGALYLDGGRFGIIVSEGCPTRGHRSFTIGHELGHYRIEGHADAMFVGGIQQVLSEGGHFRDRHSTREREADWFASELLMPSGWAQSRVRALPATLASIKELAREFGVSFSCAGVRYAELTDEAVALVISKDRRIEWVAFSSRIQEHDWSRRAWRKNLVPAYTATDRLARAPERVLAGGAEEEEAPLCTWFDDAPPMVLATEDAMGLGEYGRVATLLVSPRLPTPDEVLEDEDDRSDEKPDWRDPLRRELGYKMD